jgi:glucoamylase
VVDSVLESQTASGPGWHRYGVKAGQLGQPAGGTDGYGDCYVPDPTSCSRLERHGSPLAPDPVTRGRR